MVTHAAQGDTFWDIVRKGAEAAAAKDNVKLLYSSDPDGGKQAQLVQTAIDQKVDGIIVTLAKPDAMQGRRRRRPPRAGHPGRQDQLRRRRSPRSSARSPTSARTSRWPARRPASKLNELGVKNAVCVIQEQGNVGLEERCAGAKKTFDGQMENLFVNGADMPQVKSSITAKLQAGKGIDGDPHAGRAVRAHRGRRGQGGRQQGQGRHLRHEQGADRRAQGRRIQFAVDQQPYLQGYLAVDELWLYKRNGNIIGGGQPVLTGPAIVDKSNVGRRRAVRRPGTR